MACGNHPASGVLVWLAFVASVCASMACTKSPSDDFNAFLQSLDLDGQVEGAIDAPAVDTAADATTDQALPDGSSGPDFTGDFVLVFTTALKPEGSSDVVLKIIATAAPGGVTLSGKAVARTQPDVVLGTIEAAQLQADGTFTLVIPDFLIPPGQEALLPDGGTAKVTLVAKEVGEDSFCGDIDFHLVKPIDVPQPGVFACYRVGAVEPGKAGCAQ